MALLTRDVALDFKQQVYVRNEHYTYGKRSTFHLMALRNVNLTNTFGGQHFATNKPHRIPDIYHFRGKQSDTEKTVVYIGTRHFAGKLFVYICSKLTWSSNTLFQQQLILFYSLSGKSRSGYYCIIFMILFGCLVTHRIRGMTVVRFLFDTGHNRPVVRRQSHMHLFKMFFTDDMMRIHSAWLHCTYKSYHLIV